MTSGAVSRDTGVVLRDITDPEGFRQCVSLQEEVWGEGFSERVPLAILMVSQRIGGVVTGAWDRGGDLVGFVFGITGWEEGNPVHWSDMLAVRPGLRDGGLGTRLKLHQREVLLGRGVTRMYWTFDPLESRNAYLNLERLGAVSREYVVDMYGSSGSNLHAGLPTDRLVALWEMDSPRVRERLAVAETGEAPRSGQATGTRDDGRPPAGAVDDSDLPHPPEPNLDIGDSPIEVTIPARFQDLRRAAPGLALAWRRYARSMLVHHLDRGWEVRGLRRGGPVSHLRLERRDPESQ
ncbi:MAG: GNAT family N-acetyltransferase [Gemmatimonadota bacterium]